MAGASQGYHENEQSLSSRTKDLHRAIVSLQEELEAIDWYQQRVDATGDADLRDILAHNRDEEIEHAAMTLEWIRRQSPRFDSVLRQYLFTEGSITAREAAVVIGQEGNGTPRASRSIGSLRGGR